MNKKRIISSLFVCPLLLISSCGKSSSSSSSEDSTIPSSTSEINQNEIIQPDGSNVNGTYAAEIWPVNYNLHLKSIGFVGMERNEDKVTTSVYLKYGPKKTKVKQALYTGRRCPNLKDDLNKDAYIDILESQIAIGKITVPFDANINSQMDGYGQFPFVDESGKMFYTQTASFDLLFQDLKTIDENPEDELIKLEDNDGITLPGRVVLFQGVPENTFIPETVATVEGMGPRESLPVGCAVLWKVKKMPIELSSGLE